MESRKYQLQKQIIEALNSNDADLYSLLRSQWAHRFGVESLDELKNLDQKQPNQNSSSINNQNTDQLRENLFEDDKSKSIEEIDKHEEQIKFNHSERLKDDNNESIKLKSYEKANKESGKSEDKKSPKYIKHQIEIEALIPMPPKPKYSYLKKWLLCK